MRKPGTKWSRHESDSLWAAFVDTLVDWRAWAVALTYGALVFLFLTLVRP